MQSHDILRHIYGDLKAPAGHLSGELIRFDQLDFLGADAAYASMGRYGYVYVPEAVKRGAPLVECTLRCTAASRAIVTSTT